MMDRLASERDFHDAQARQRVEILRDAPEQLRLDDVQYLEHESWIRPAMAELGDVRDQPVLDFGCGHGMASVALARRGASVVAFDLSLEYLKEARTRAQANDVSIAFVQAEGERLPFADGAFAAIWGNAVLHHLDLRRAGWEIRRVLQPGGVAVFCEPWGENPILNWARRRLPYAGKDRTPHEQPFRQRDVRILKQIFPAVNVQGFQLLSMLRRVVSWRGLLKVLSRIDDDVLTRWKSCQRYCRYSVITLRR
jgi:SAM-dependent methyltransferase